MPEIRFYHLQTQSQEQALPLLLTKAYERGMRVVVKLRDEVEVERLNETLWTFNADAFLPHGSKKDGKAQQQPIWLTSQDENPNDAGVLFLGQGALETALETFTLRCEMLDGRDPQSLEEARTRWKKYKDQGFDVTYWQQTERGGWEQKA